ncbi:hypothetical protein glysoja_023414 [Glycine soja]|nr:hypothetical protein glysoja_023414 [Glycine soja]
MCGAEKGEPGEHSNQVWYNCFELGIGKWVWGSYPGDIGCVQHPSLIPSHSEEPLGNGFM